MSPLDKIVLGAWSLAVIASGVCAYQMHLYWCPTWAVLLYMAVVVRVTLLSIAIPPKAPRPFWVGVGILLQLGPPIALVIMAK